MADKMMRIAGRGNDGLAKSLRVDNIGNVLIDDSYNKRVEQIVNIIGEGNINLFLTFKEKDEVYRDLFNERLAFTPTFAGRWTSKEGGPLGNYISNDNSLHSVLIQRPIIEVNNGNQEPAFGKKYATKIKLNSGLKDIAMVRLKLKGNGSLPSEYKVSVHRDNGGKPGEKVITNSNIFIKGDKDYIGSTLDPTAYNWVYITLKHNVPVSETNTYWLVLEYVDDTAVDNQNYVSWQYGDDPNGEISIFNGTEWVNETGKSFHYGLYDSSLELPKDFSYLVLYQSNNIYTGSNNLPFFSLRNQKKRYFSSRG